MPVGLQTFILIFVTSLLIITFGGWFNRQIGDRGKTPNTKFAIELTIGSIALGLVVGLMSGTATLKPSLSALGTALAVFIYFLIVAGAYNLLRNFGLKEVLPTPRE